MRIGKRLLAEVQRDDVAGMSAELAYRFLFAVFPFGIFVAALTAFVAQWAGIDGSDAEDRRRARATTSRPTSPTRSPRRSRR